jgi:tRNA (guanine10-N2)-dimethyltransferase
MLLFHLSGENLELAREEIMSLARVKSYQQVRNILIADAKYTKAFDNLAYTHGIFDILFACNSDELAEEIGIFDFNKYCIGDFRARILDFSFNGIKFNEKELGTMVWRRLKNPTVNLENPETQFFFVFVNYKVICCRLIKNIEKTFYNRKPHLKPEMNPTSLSPKLAKALINLSGVRRGKVLDPFCGSGGILVEAGLMGLKPIGYDIEGYILEKARKNLEYYGINNFEIEQKDSTKIKGRYNHIVSELPFGKNSRITDELETLYLDFLLAMDKMPVKKAVLVFPDTVCYKKLIEMTKLKILNEFDYYVHKSMTRKIVVLSH